MSTLKLTGAAAFLAVAAVGCASSGNGPRADIDGASRATVSALSFSPETRAPEMSKWPLEWNVRVIETYTFAPPAVGGPALAENGTATSFSADLPPGTVFVEAAGADGTTRARRVIQHSPNPR